MIIALLHTLIYQTHNPRDRSYTGRGDFIFIAGHNR